MLQAKQKTHNNTTQISPGDPLSAREGEPAVASDQGQLAHASTSIRERLSGERLPESTCQPKEAALVQLSSTHCFLGPTGPALTNPFFKRG